MSTQRYAHSIPNEPQSAWQPLEEHLLAVAKMAREFAHDFGLQDWAYLAGLWHDLGKYSDRFQNDVLGAGDESGGDAHIEGKQGRVDHSTAGAQWATAQEHFGIASRLLSYAIAGHHSGLLDFDTDPSLRRRLAKNVASISPPEEIVLPPEAASPAVPEWLDAADGFSLSFAIRMIFSCLVDADFLDTEGVYDQEKHERRGVFPTLNALRNALEARLKRFEGSDNNPVNRVRREVSKASLNAATIEPGFFSLTVPTGGGKTLASLRFALHHALHHEKKRIIYAIPYTSIIEQTASEFRGMFGDAVVEHHSQIEIDEKEETSRTRLAADNWDAPLLVTTNAQFFESLFSNRTSRCRKLHNIANSVIVLDEAQVLPVSLLEPTLAALRELVQHYGCSVVLCTATQPALVKGGHLKQGLERVREIVPDSVKHFKVLKRVRFEHIGTVSYDELAKRIGEHAQTLCIVNSRRDAQEIYSRIRQDSDIDSCFYLTTFLCPIHREKVFAEIRACLADKKPCRIVSTQLIEAGVDISFPTVFRAMTGLDSIVQAAGRCNRNGESAKGNVFIFEGERPPPPGFLSRTAALGNELLSSWVDPSDPEIITEYFTRLYRYEGANLDARKIIQLIESDGARSLQFEFRQIARQYKLITNEEMPIVIRYDESAERLIKELSYKLAPRKVLRKLQAYTITVPQRHFHALERRGDIRIIADLIAVLERTDLYDRHGMGFTLKEFADMEPAGLVV